MSVKRPVPPCPFRPISRGKRESEGRWGRGGKCPSHHVLSAPHLERRERVRRDGGGVGSAPPHHVLSAPHLEGRGRVRADGWGGEGSAPSHHVLSAPYLEGGDHRRQVRFPLLLKVVLQNPDEHVAAWENGKRRSRRQLAQWFSQPCVISRYRALQYRWFRK